VGLEAAFLPIMLAVMYLVYSMTAYPFGVLADPSIAGFSWGLRSRSDRPM
jgi:hypothetical protein